MDDDLDAQLECQMNEARRLRTEKVRREWEVREKAECEEREKAKREVNERAKREAWEKERCDMEFQAKYVTFYAL